jgi:hypothetical protein
MDIYTVETDGLLGFQVKVARPDGAVYLTSSSLFTLSDTRKWIDEHRRSSTKVEVAPNSNG